MLHKEGGGEQRRQIEEGVNIESTNRSIRAQKSLSLCEMLAKSSELCRQLIVLCRQVEVVGARGRGRQKDAWQTSLQRGERGGGVAQVLFGLHYTIILLPEIMVSSRATCQKHSMSLMSAPLLPPCGMWVSVGFTHTHTLTHVSKFSRKLCKSRKSLANPKKKGKTKKK